MGRLLSLYVPDALVPEVPLDISVFRLSLNFHKLNSNQLEPAMTEIYGHRYNNPHIWL